jgi:hypothetical protein
LIVSIVNLKTNKQKSNFLINSIYSQILKFNQIKLL